MVTAGSRKSLNYYVLSFLDFYLQLAAVIQQTFLKKQLGYFG